MADAHNLAAEFFLLQPIEHRSQRHGVIHGAAAPVECETSAFAAAFPGGESRLASDSVDLTQGERGQFARGDPLGGKFHR